jgi:prefoldin subunit 5
MHHIEFDYMETQTEMELRLIRECHKEISSQLNEITKQLQILNEELKIINEAIKSYQNSKTSIDFTDYNAE